MKYTPFEITESKQFFSIPIYQRLFEWDTDNIVTLLDDLYKEYEQSNGQGDYYIGMLTSTNQNELVDDRLTLRHPSFRLQHIPLAVL